jgi:hypothetical protein
LSGQPTTGALQGISHSESSGSSSSPSSGFCPARNLTTVYHGQKKKETRHQNIAKTWSTEKRDWRVNNCAYDNNWYIRRILAPGKWYSETRAHV